VLLGAHNPEYLNVVAIADIRPYNVFRAFHGDVSSPSANTARPGLMAKYKWSSEDEARTKVKVYGAYEDLLADDDIEAVVIALPLHLHAEAAIKAMRAGKHVLTEKLMGHSIHECKEMGRVSRETGKILATGHQRHYSVLYDNAVHTIGRAGLLGELHSIRAQWHRGNLPGNDSWKPPMPDDESLAKKLVGWKKDLETAKPADIDAAHQENCAARGADLRRPGRCREVWLHPHDARRRRDAFAAPGAHPLAALEPHRRRPDGGTRQSSARRGRHLCLGDARRGEEGEAADGHGRRQP
jgi:hypothetical protein